MNDVIQVIKKIFGKHNKNNEMEFYENSFKFTDQRTKKEYIAFMHNGYLVVNGLFKTKMDNLAKGIKRFLVRLSRTLDMFEKEDLLKRFEERMETFMNKFNIIKNKIKIKIDGKNFRKHIRVVLSDYVSLNYNIKANSMWIKINKNLTKYQREISRNFSKSFFDELIKMKLYNKRTLIISRKVRPILVF